jgi:hypothetical protein
MANFRPALAPPGEPPLIFFRIMPLAATQLPMPTPLALLVLLTLATAGLGQTTPGGSYRAAMLKLDAGQWARRDVALDVMKRIPADASMSEALLQYVILDTQLAKWRKTEAVYHERWHTLEAQVLNRQALILPGDRDPLDIVLRRTNALLADLRKRNAPRLDAEASALASLAARAGTTAVDQLDERWTLYLDACKLRRGIAFKNPLLNFDKILFCTHGLGANHICDQYLGRTQRAGGGIYVLENPFSANPRARNLLDGKRVGSGALKDQPLEGGAFLSLDLDFDAATIAFAWSQCQPGPGARGQPSPGTSWHLFSVGADGNNLRQLTDGIHNDFDPCFLPSGRMVFISDRRGGFGRCHPRPVESYTLHGMMRDGSDIIPLSYHETNEWQPSVDNNGMLVYTRWDYVDRDPVIAHHLWLTYPDGRDPRSYHGNYPSQRAWRPDAELAARAIPGSSKYLAVAAPHHGHALGSLVLIDQQVEDDNAMSQVKRITPDFPFPEVESNTNWRQKPPLPPEDTNRNEAAGFGTPWPLDESYYLCSHDPLARKHGLYLVDAFGNRELLHRDEGFCHDPIPLRPRPRPAALPVLTTAAKADRQSKPNPVATISVMNVYDSDFEWPKGAKVTALRLIQIYPKSTPLVDNPNMGTTAQSLGRGVLGTVPVDPDGSAFFEAPVGVPFYFQALGADGCAIQSMRSVTYVHPGETLSCQGCHESKTKPSVPRAPSALRRGPSKVVAEVDGAWPLSFPRLVQPVLDRQCVACHVREKARPLDGASDAKQPHSRAFATLRPFVNYCGGSQGVHLRPYASGGGSRSIAGEFGAKASRLFTQILSDDKHRDLPLTPDDRHRLTLWIDGNANFFGTYQEVEAQKQGDLIRPGLQ